MANGFGSLYVGASGLRGSQNALNVAANNLSNLDTKGYVRQQTFFVDDNYVKFATASISDQAQGLGVQIGDVIHTRDQFLDASYRKENGRHAFYAAGYEAASEVETLLQEGAGESFSSSIEGLYQAFNEFAKDPNQEEVENLVVQKASMFISRAKAVNKGMSDYQLNINEKIRDDVNRINNLSKTIYQLNVEIQRTEAGKVETAMAARDARDQALDELSKLASISYDENVDGIVRVKIEGQPFVDVDRVYKIEMYEDKATGFVLPYWPQLSDVNRGGYYEVFNTKNVDPTKNTDIGEIKSLLLARGDHKATYQDMIHLTSAQYDMGLSKSIMMNEQAELDLMIHSMIEQVNQYLSPVETLSDTKYGQKLIDDGFISTDPANPTTVFVDGKELIITQNTVVLDEDNCCLGNDREMPPKELFSRRNTERYTKVTLSNAAGETKDLYIYNEEDPEDTATLYTLDELEANKALVEQPGFIPHVHQNDNIAYDVAQNIYDLWNKDGFTLNPSDKTPCSFENFYAKMCGELADAGSVYKTTSESLEMTRDQIESSRQGVIGVNADEELTDMIKYQNAYNASSRYINVVSAMIDTLINSMGR
ncbi:flagellar hook-associated protein 1 FlgK [Lachnospiraceae bacterium C10]|nr:flagellar hook-associated protein 1 FlgK [Lachnospiraceae bacterium C10]